MVWWIIGLACAAAGVLGGLALGCLQKKEYSAAPGHRAAQNARLQNVHSQNTRSQNARLPNSEVRIPEKNETGTMIYYANEEHESGDREYRFNYKKVGGSWRAYIIRMPSLKGRSGDGHSTHRHWDGDKPYICWNSTVNSLHDMQSISRIWADSIQEYIATGKRFG